MIGAFVLRLSSVSEIERQCKIIFGKFGTLFEVCNIFRTDLVFIGPLTVTKWMVFHWFALQPVRTVQLTICSGRD